MKPKTMILMAVAIACGLGASYMTSRLLAERQDSEPDTVQVWVAKKTLDMGTLVKKPSDLFETKPFLKGTEPQNAVVKIDDLKGRQLKRTLKPGDPIRSDDIFAIGEAFLDALLPKGFRAVGLRVNLETTAAGFASLPGSRVDIISTMRRGSDRDSFSQVLLQNVLVLAADGIKDRNESGQAMAASVVTVALSTEDALKITLAKEIGPLSLVLRKFDDSAKEDVEKVTVEQLLTKTRAGKTDDTVDTDVPGPTTTVVEVKPEPKPEPRPQQAKVEPKSQPKVEPEPVEVAKAPGRWHTVTIIEGDKIRYQKFYVDENDNVIDPPAAVGGTLLPEVPNPQPNPQTPANVTPPAPRPKAPAPAN